ncbi:hypothetical protein TspCOW1_03420 [Thiohalobacter sp. COW1]|uniref:sulfotransferase family protein n=1 Tax=Thiohalobacter sp. COW1 TaxID=2795687 RepID=UPI0019169133|nr:sulfotransferase [Thiohalobacter sp. COW1]BCO30239.1 hypothetical protein TspCOW1_03420 [Thiohalobacter sp. COW1]
MGRRATAYYLGRLELEFWLRLKWLVQHAWHGPRRRGPAAVSFIAGVQRSGTNMLMDVLEQSLLTDVYHERDPRAFDNYSMRETDIIAALHARCRAPHFIIKSLCELQRLPQLRQRFPGTRIVWIVRHYDDVVNSMLVSFRNHASQIRRLAQDKLAVDWRGEGMSDATQALLRRFAGPELSDAGGAALMWYLRNVLFFEQGFDRDEKVLLVSYERLVAMPQAEFARIFAFLGLPYRPWHSRRVVASSVGKRQPPAIEPAVRAECDALLARFHALLPAAPGEAA